MRTAKDTEMIVTDLTTPASGNEYILVAIQKCNFHPEEETKGEEGDDKKD